MTKIEKTEIRAESGAKFGTNDGTESRTERGTKTGTETKTEVGTKTGKEPGTENGSPAPKRCTTIALFGTADEESTAENIKSPENERTVITAGTVPLDRIPQAVSKEIHTYGGLISKINIRRTDRDDYAISLIVRSPKNRSPKTGGGSSPRGGRHAD